MKKPTFLIISLLALALIIFALFELSKAPLLRELRSSVKNKLAILSNNLSDFISPSRRPPITTIELEEILKANLPTPFAKFNQDDWRWFWQLLYGRFTEDARAWPRRKRQYTKEEVQNMLAYYYFQPFDSFGEREWSIFWRQILKGRVFK